MASGQVGFLGKTCAFDEETHLRRSADQRSFLWQQPVHQGTKNFMAIRGD